MAPLRAARGVECVNRLYEIFCRSRGDVGRLKNELMISIDVTAVLAVYDLRSYFADDGNQTLDDVRERNRVQALIGKTEDSQILDPQFLSGRFRVRGLPHASRAISKRLP